MDTCLKAIATLVLVFSSALAHATVYKCTSADGKVAFQDIPCASRDASEQVRIRAQPTEADVAAAHARNRPVSEMTGNGDNPVPSVEGGSDAFARSVDPSPPTVARQSEQRGAGPCPPGQVPLNASRFDSSRGWSDSKGYVPLRCGSGAASRGTSPRLPPTGPGHTEPRQLLDQHGNVYFQPPGSPVPIEVKTGKPCVVNGTTIVHCN